MDVTNKLVSAGHQGAPSGARTAKLDQDLSSQGSANIHPAMNDPATIARAAIAAKASHARTIWKGPLRPSSNAANPPRPTLAPPASMLYQH